MVKCDNTARLACFRCQKEEQGEIYFIIKLNIQEIEIYFVPIVNPDPGVLMGFNPNSPGHFFQIFSATLLRTIQAGQLPEEALLVQDATSLLLKSEFRY